MPAPPGPDLSRDYPKFYKLTVALLLTAGFGIPVPLAARQPVVTIVYIVVSVAAVACLVAWVFIRRRYDRRAGVKVHRNQQRCG